MTFYSIVDRMKEKITVNISWPENITEKFLVENYQQNKYFINFESNGF